MPNWCNSAYTIVGKQKEMKALYKLMKNLEDMKEPAVPNGFGTSWLGCLVNALGADWKEIYCRGDWESLEYDGYTINFITTTAWGPCNDVWDLVQKKYPSIEYYFQAEEPGMGVFQTNDTEGDYYPDRFIVNLCTADGNYIEEYFRTQDAALLWIGEQTGITVQSQEDMVNVNEQLHGQNENAFCCLHEYELVE